MSDTLTPEQLLAIAALAEGCTANEAARRADVHKSQISRWRQQPAFARALETSLHRNVSAATRRLRGKLGDAVETVDAIRRGNVKGTPADLRVKLDAARLLIDRAHHLSEVSIASRIRRGVQEGVEALIDTVEEHLSREEFASLLRALAKVQGLDVGSDEPEDMASEAVH